MINSSDTSGQFGFRLRMAVVPAIWLVFGAGSVLADTLDPGNTPPTVQQDFQFHCAAHLTRMQSAQTRPRRANRWRPYHRRSPFPRF